MPADLTIRNATVIDGSGSPGFAADVSVQEGRIVAVGEGLAATREVDGTGMVLSPGFVDTYCHDDGAFIRYPGMEFKVAQGVTTCVNGNCGFSSIPNIPGHTFMPGDIVGGRSDWTDLDSYFDACMAKSPAINSIMLVGHNRIRSYVIGLENRAPSADKLAEMRAQVEQAMEQGACGFSTGLIYEPGRYSMTDELVALCKEAGKYGGGYISHMRSEGNKLYEAVQELITIAREAKVHGEIYHLKAGGKDNWSKMDTVFKMVEKARKEGVDIGANIYTYIAGGTGLTASMPPTLQDGGFGKLRERLQDSAIRLQTIKDMKSNATTWENLYYGAGSADKLILVGFTKDSLKKYTGKTLAEVALIRGKSPEETAMDLIVQDSSRVGTIYFLMDEENVKKELAQPWVSFGSDEGSYTNAGAFLKTNAHPRAYGNFARVIGKYVRDEKIIPLEEAVRKLTKLSAEKLHIQKRGEIKVGNYADILIFDPSKVQDHATFEKPHQYATGMIDVFVNGVQVLKDGEHTEAKPGRFVKGPGYVNKK